jgi:hypothetical protein
VFCGRVPGGGSVRRGEASFFFPSSWRQHEAALRMGRSGQIQRKTTPLPRETHLSSAFDILQINREMSLSNSENAMTIDEQISFLSFLVISSLS